jgi:hypothetical protein
MATWLPFGKDFIRRERTSIPPLKQTTRRFGSPLTPKRSARVFLRAMNPLKSVNPGIWYCSSFGP